MDPNDEEFQKKLKDSLGNESIEIGKDLMEVPLELLVTSAPGLLHSIPVAGTLVALGKMGMAAREYSFSKKLISFINEFNKGSINREKLKKFKEKLSTDAKYRTKTLETISTIIDRLFDAERAIIAANLFRTYVNGSIDWNYFLELSFALELLRPQAYGGLRELYFSTLVDKKKKQEIKHTMAISIEDEPLSYEAALISAGLATKSLTRLSLTRLGRSLFEFGLYDQMEKWRNKSEPGDE